MSTSAHTAVRMYEVLLDKVVGELRVNVSARSAVLYATFEGNITNGIEDEFRQLLDQIRELSVAKSELILDVAKVDFCYSTGVKSFLALGQDFDNRPPMKFLISNKTWQITIRSIAGFSPNCSVEKITSVSSPMPPSEACLPASTQPAVCYHTNTRTESENFFAPTGKGTIVTKTICEQCGFELSVDREYFD